MRTGEPNIANREVNFDSAHQIRCGPAGEQFAGVPGSSTRSLRDAEPRSMSRGAARANDDYKEVIIGAVKEVGGPSFFALLVIAVSFLPVFTLEAQEGRLFKPLAFTKNFSIAIAAILSITLVPVVLMLFIRLKKFEFRPSWLAKVANAILVGKIYNEENHPISRPLMKIYHPVIEFVLEHKWMTIAAAVLAMAVTIPIYFRLGSEFMPPLDEGVLLYMPSTLPGMSITEASRILQMQDKILKSFPEVVRVFGKAGRAETATDSAPFSMMATVVVLKPATEWPKKQRWYSNRAPEWMQRVLRRAWPDHKSTQEFIYGSGGLNEAMQFPGIANAWTMPIKARIDMLTTGVRTPLGIKILGSDLGKIQEIGESIEMALKGIPGTTSVFAERTTGGYFLDFDLKRDQLARYGLTVDDAQNVLMSAVGGEKVTTTVEGRERYPVNVRLPARLQKRYWRPTTRLALHAFRSAGPARSSCRHSSPLRAGNDPRRKRSGQRLRLRGRFRSRHRELR
jgi:copper/silver efflux system protein